MDSNLRRKGRICHRCGRDDFKSEYQLSSHLRTCTGAKPKGDEPARNNKKRSATEMKERNQYFKEVMQTKRHDDWQEPFDVLKKRRSNKDKNVHDGSPTSSTLKPEEEDVGRKTDYEMYFEGAEDFMDEDDSESSDGGLESESEDSSTAAFKNPDDTPEQKAKAPFKSDVGPIPHSWSFQIELASLLSKHRTDLSLYNEIVDLTKKHTNGSKLKFSTDHLLKRKAIITKLEKNI